MQCFFVDCGFFMSKANNLVVLTYITRFFSYIYLYQDLPVALGALVFTSREMARFS